MRLFEISNTSNEEVIEAIQSWFEMWQPAKQVSVILKSPLSQNFTNANASEIYRCVIVSKTGGIKNPVTTKQIIVYTSDISNAHRFYNSLDISNDYLVVKKVFHSNDLILNFSELANSLGQSGGWDENELWMRPTPYYTTVDQSEIVYDSRKDK